MKFDKDLLEKTAFAVGDFGIQLEFLARSLNGEDREWTEVQALFPLFTMLADKINDACDVLHELTDAYKADLEETASS